MSSLEGASKYLNNLLLARGLLHDGKLIDFAHPAHATGTTDATMAKVINLVHDLVLRRDRDAEKHETLASSIRNMRAADTQRLLDLERLQGKNEQLSNDAATAQAQERSTRTLLKKLETQVKELRDQNLRMKSLLDQVRAKCTSDVRKRDIEIEKLKAHLTNTQRGKKEASGMKINIINPQATAAGREHRGGQDVHSPDWSLEKETNDFLAALVNETSAENVTLRQIMNGTLDTLRDMAGLHEDEIEDDDDDNDGIGIPGQYRKSRQVQAEGLVPIELMADQINGILEHCRSILRDPSFVPVEEVHVRDEEIAKLRAGWEKMADRWKEAVTMMGQWKQKMVQDGAGVNVAEFSDLSFGRSAAVRPDGQPVLNSESEMSSIFDHSELEATVETSVLTDHVIDRKIEEEEPDLDLSPEPVPKRLASSPAKRGVKLPRKGQPLGETNGNSTARLSIDSFDSPLATPVSASDRENGPAKSKSSRKKVTVSEKLAAVEAEAIEAKQQRQRDSLRKRKTPTVKNGAQKTGRRKSTLSPAELAAMMNTG